MPARLPSRSRGVRAARAPAVALIAPAIGLCLVAALAILAAPLDAAAQCTPLTFVVNTTADLADPFVGNGVCGPREGCSLRAALEEANAAACGPTTIHFDIPGKGPHVITPASALPVITRAVVIDGYTQPGASPNTATIFQPGNAALEVELRGTGDVAVGLYVSCPDGELRASVVRGLVLNGFTTGAFVNSGCDGVTFVGNYVGVSADGQSAGAGTMAYGVLVQNAAGNHIGTPNAADRNVVSGATAANVYLVGTLDPSNEAFRVWGNEVVNTFVGTDASGDAAIGGTYGIVVAGPGVTPGVPDPDVSTPQHDDGNRILYDVVAGQAAAGILVRGGSDSGGNPLPAVGTHVAANIVGHGTQAFAFLASGGVDPVPAPAAGLGIGQTGIQIGSVSPDAAASQTVVQQNAVTQSATGIDVQSPDDAQTWAVGNLVWGNQGDGIRFAAFSSLARNLIWDNGGLGLRAEVAAADPLPWVTLDAVTETTVAGSLDFPFAMPPSFSCVRTRIEVFASDDCDPSGWGEGREIVEEVDLDGCPSSFALDRTEAPYPRPEITMTSSWVLGVNLGGSVLELAPISSDFSSCETDPAPEPGSLAQLASGVALLIVLRRRGRSRG